MRIDIALFQKKLQIMTCESMLLSSDCASRKDMLVKIEEEALQAEEVTHTHTHTFIDLCKTGSVKSTSVIAQWLNM